MRPVHLSPQSVRCCDDLKGECRQGRKCPLNTANSDGSSNTARSLAWWDTFSPVRLLLLVYGAVALVIAGCLFWPEYMVWLAK